MKTVDCTLHFREIVTEEECNQLREILDILDIRYTIMRKKDVQDAISWLRRKGPPSQRSIPLDFYDFGIQAYVFGFDIAAVFYCSSAIEIMITLLLEKNCRNHGGKKIGSYSKLLKKAKAEGMLNKEAFRIADDLRLLRNYYVHYVSHVEYLNELCENSVELAKDHFKTQKELAEFLGVLDDFRKTIIDQKSLGTRYQKVEHGELRVFLDRNDKDYEKWCKINKFELLGEISKMDIKRIRHFSRDRFNALSAISAASEILKEFETSGLLDCTKEQHALAEYGVKNDEWLEDCLGSPRHTPF